MLIASFLIFSGVGAWASGSSGGIGSASEIISYTDSEGLGTFEKYDPPIDVTFVRYAPPVATANYPEGDSVENNIWTRAYLEKVGINVKYLWVVDASQYQTKFNLMLASGDLPDFFQTNLEQFSQLVEADQLEDLSDIFKMHATSGSLDLWKLAGPYLQAQATVDGKLLGLPHAVWREASPILYVRNDWLKKLNLSAPETMQDVLAISKAFTEQDPDGNNKDDTIGLAIDNSLNLDVGSTSGLAGFYESYHAYPGIWVEEPTGKLGWGAVQPEMKTALQALQKLYKDGQINKEFPTEDGNKVNEYLISGKAGIFYGPYWTPLHPLQQGRNLDSNYDWISLPIRSVDSAPAKIQHISTAGIFVCARKGVKYPEALFKIFEVGQRIRQAGSEDIFYKYISSPEGTELWINQAPVSYGGGGPSNIDAYRDFTLPVMRGEITLAEIPPDQREGIRRINAFYEGDNAMWCWARISEEGGAISVIRHYYDEDLHMPDGYYGPITDTMAQKKPILDKLALESFTRIILGDPIDDFDAFVTKWKAQGGDELTKEVNDWYAKQ